MSTSFYRSGYGSRFASSYASGFGGSNAPVPAGVPNLELWLDGRDLTGADGASIGIWAKRAGASGTDATQGSGGLQPIIKKGANGLNGLPVARFDGSVDSMLATFNPGSTGLTFYIVGRTGSALTAYGTPVGSGGGVGADNPTAGVNWWLTHGNSGDGSGAGSGGAGATIGLGDPPGLATNQAFSVRYRTDKVAWSITGNGGSTPADTSFPTGTFNLSLGCASTVGTVPSGPFNGDVAAVLVYSRAVTTPEDVAIRAYLASVWGV